MSLDSSEEPARLLRRFRVVLGFFIFGLVISGVTAFPLLWEMDLLVSMLGLESENGARVWGGFGGWIRTVHAGLREMYSVHPWIAYGTDWLGFAHIAIAVFFYGPWKDPVRNIWVLRAGLIACALIVPLALICGEVRGIPLGWRMIDCSFGVIGALPLWYCVRLTRRIEGLGAR
jgi:hypothetical protein